MISDEILENIFDAGFQCSTKEFNQQRFKEDGLWAMNSGIWEFHIEFHKWKKSKNGKMAIRSLQAYIEREKARSLEEGYNKGRDDNRLLKRLKDLLSSEGHDVCDSCGGNHPTEDC